MGRSTVPDSGEILTHQHHIFRKIGTARTQGKMSMVVYLGGVAHPPRRYRLLTITCHKYHVKERTQTRPFEE